MKSERTEFESAYALGRAAAVEPVDIAGIAHVVIPPGSRLESLEHLQDAPRRIQASPEFFDVDGFIDYTEEFAQDGTRIFVDYEQRRFFTVFDAHAPGAPAWGDHCASMQMNRSPEWVRFCSVSGQKMDPLTLAEFLEENVDYFVGPVVGAELLSMAQNLKIELKGDLTISHTTQAGLRELSIRDDSTLAGRAGEKTLSFPERVELRLRVFEHAETYKVEPFLRYRGGKDGVLFWLQIPDSQAIENAAFDRVIATVAERSKMRTLKGKYQGPRHK